MPPERYSQGSIERELALLAVRYDLSTMLRAMAKLMQDMGCPTARIVTEVAAIESWIEGITPLP